MYYIMGSWATPSQNYIGLHVAPASELDTRDKGLTSVELVRGEAVPSPWCSFAFAYHLRDSGAYGQRAVELGVLFLKGILSGVLTASLFPFRQEKAPAQSVYLGDVLKASLPNALLGDSGFIVLRNSQGTVVAAFHPECLFFPSATFSDWPDSPDKEREIALAVASLWTHENDRLLYRLLLNLMDLSAAEESTEAWKQLASKAVEQMRLRGVVPGQYDSTELVVLASVPILKQDGTLGSWDITYVCDDFMKVSRLTLAAAGTVHNRKLTPSLQLTNPEDPDFRIHLQEADFDKLGLPLIRAANHFYYIEDLPFSTNSWKVDPTCSMPLVFHRTHMGQCIHVAVEAQRFRIEDVLCREVAGMTTSGGEQAFPEWPVAGEYMHLMRTVKRAPVAPLDNSVAYELTFKAGDTVQREVAIAADVDHQLAIWPDFEHTSWRYYQLYHGTGSGLSKAFGLNLFKSSPDSGMPDPIVSPSKTAVGLPFTHLTERPDFVEVFSTVDTRCRYGIYRLARPSVIYDSIDRITCSAALDFGTANSCLSVRIGESSSVMSFGSHWQPLFGLDVSDSIRENIHGTTLAGADEVPSELVMHEALSEALRDAATAIPHPGVNTTGRIQSGWLLSGFKWTDDRLWPGTSLTAQQDIRRACLLYLTDLLRQVAAECVEKVQLVRLRASYPHAFSSEQIDRYHRTLKDAADLVGSDTGVSFEIEGYVSESVSAIASSLGAAQDFDYCLAMDMGGGTVDYAVTPPLDLKADAGGTFHYDDSGMFVSSLRFAGHAILQAVSSWIRNERGFQSADLGSYESAAQLKLMAWIRLWRKGVKDGPLREPLLGISKDPRIMTAVSRLMNDSFIAIIYYGCLLLASRIVEDARDMEGSSANRRKPGFKVLLIGNGWSLCALDSDQFSQWNTASDAREAEAGYVRHLIELCWADIRADSGACSKQLQNAKLQSIERSLGKQNASEGMFRSLPYKVEQAQTREWSSMLGVTLQHKTPPAVIPAYTLIGSRGLKLGNETPKLECSGTWGMPARLKLRLGGDRDSDKEIRAKLNRCLTPDIFKQDSTASFLIRNSPLKLLLESELVKVLSKP